MNDHKKEVQNANQSVESKKIEVLQSYWYLQYHAAPRAFWMNDPNGFSFFKNTYHLFFQHHPYSAEWGPMHWGHFKSKDLVHWESLPIALAPSEDYDRDGCFSGSAIEKDGKLYLMYTGNVWTGDNHDEDLKQTQALAISEDGVHFKKLSSNPVISSPPSGDIHPAHFRDPKVWEHNGSYYCVIGSKTKANKGQVLLYRSRNLENWEFVNVMAKSEGNLGYMWECPDLFTIDNQDVLVMSPQGLEPEGHLYHNLHQSGYLVGTLDYDTGVFSHGEFHLLDYGFDFYAPQTLIDDKGRRILIAWMEMWESNMPTQSEGWAGAITLPRVLEWKQHQLYARPVPELQSLRGKEWKYQDIRVLDTLMLEGLTGDCYELKVMMEQKDAKQFGLHLRANDDLSQKTTISYDTTSQVITLDREQSGKGKSGQRQVKVSLMNETLTLHIFVDRSSIEIFINEGEKVMTARIFPDESSQGIQFFSDGEIMVRELKKWDLNKAF